MTTLRIVDPETNEVGLSFVFDSTIRSAIVVNGFHGSQVTVVGPNDDELFLYFVNVENFGTGTAPVLAEGEEPRKLVAPVL